MEEVTCGSSTCNYHNLNDAIISDLREAVKALVVGQVDMKLSVTQLVEAFKSMDRLEIKIDKLESTQAERNEKQDIKIDELRVFMYKCLGAGAAIMAVGGLLLRFIGG